MDRRRFLALAAASASTPLLALSPLPPTSLAPWREGFLDIHHIATNRGNSTLIILPDGTVMMIDAGAIYGTTPYLEAPSPSAERRPGEWIGRYAQRRLKEAGLANAIDVFMLTHHHDDHMGAVPKDVAANKYGVVLTGVSDVDALVPIHRIVDRDPTFTYPAPPESYAAEAQNNYAAFLKMKSSLNSASVEKFRAGDNTQFELQRHASSFDNFEIRNLAANGEVWTGKGNTTRKFFPVVATLKKDQYPSENCCSAAIRMRYGKFSYYSGGDLPNGTNYGAVPWWDIETPVAQACGPVSVALTNHHGYYDADGPAWLRALQPRVIVIEGWDSAHPATNTMIGFTSKAIYPGERDIFATFLNQHNRIANKRTEQMKSQHGHVVVRVDPGGSTYNVHILSNADESDHVTGSFGPYKA